MILTVGPRGTAAGIVGYNRILGEEERVPEVLDQVFSRTLLGDSSGVEVGSPRSFERFVRWSRKVC